MRLELYRVQLLFILLFFCSSLIAQTSTIKTRFQISQGIDSNVFESSQHARSDLLTRFGLHTSLKRKQSDKLAAHISFQGGYEHYYRFDDDRRTIFTGGLLIDFKTTRVVQFGIEGLIRSKIFLSNQKDYLTGYGQFFVIYLLNDKKSFVKIPVRISFLNYEFFRQFNYDDNGLGFYYSHQLNKKTSYTLNASYDRIHYSRPRLLYKPADDQIIEDSLVQQKDHLLEFSASLQFNKWFLSRISYHFQINHSNSDGYGFRQYKINLVLTRKLIRKIYFQLYTTYTLKRYQKTIQEIIPLDIDTEQLQDNSLILDISKSLSRKTSLFIRFAWYKNEAFLRDRFYQKKIISVGVNMLM